MNVFAVVLVGFGLLVPLAFVAGMKLGALKSSSKLQAAESTMKAAAAVSAMAERASSRASRDWNLAMELKEIQISQSRLEMKFGSLETVLDRTDLTVGKIAEWTVLAPGRRRTHTLDPVEGFVRRTHSELPSVPRYLEAEPEESGVAMPAGPTERGQP